MAEKKRPDQVRLRASKDISILPAEGRPGQAPAWPLAQAATPAQRKRWVTMWQKPQAVMWDITQTSEVVARYVVLVLEAEKPGASTRLLAEARGMEMTLGLSPLAMFRLQWTIGDAVTRTSEAPSKLAAYREATKSEAQAS